MAREPGITQDQVSKAAERIRASGQKPTARAIREQLGTGSMATVLRFFQAWQDAQVRPAEVPVALPQGLQRGLIDFVAVEVERGRSELLTELETAKTANADLILESERQALQIQNLESLLEAAYAEKASLTGRLGQIEGERDEARSEAASERAAAESARTELAKSMLRLEAMPRLEKELDETRGELKMEREERAMAVQSAAVAEAKLQGAIEARLMIERTLADAQKHGQASDEEISLLRQELKAAGVELKAARTPVPSTATPRTKLRSSPSVVPRGSKKP